MLIDRFALDLLSDQFITWSDENRKRIRYRVAPPSQYFGATVASAGVDSARFADRALQALWQAGMQMRRRARTWTQVLPVGEFSGTAATDGLCAAGDVSAGNRVGRQLPPGTRDPGRDLYYQPRVATPARGTLKERDADCIVFCDRCGGGRHCSGQHADWLARWKPGEFVFCGGCR